MGNYEKIAKNNSWVFIPFRKGQHQIDQVPLGVCGNPGILSMSASSSRLIPSPVFPLPVMPMITAWVVRSFESYSMGTLSYSPPSPAHIDHHPE